jgi:hypothetical protein
MPPFKWPAFQEFIVLFFSSLDGIRHNGEVTTRMPNPTIDPRIITLEIRLGLAAPN